MAEEMLITTTAGDLARTLKAIRVAAPRGRMTIPVLTMAKLADGCVHVTDLDIEMSACLPNSGFAGQGLAPYWRLLRLAMAFPEDCEVVLKRSDSDGVSLHCGESRYSLSGVTADDFPHLGFSGDAVPITADFDALREAIRFCAAFVSREETRYYLNGVCLNGCDVVATDGHRLGLVENVLKRNGGDTLIIPNVAVKALLSMPVIERLSVAGLRIEARGGGVMLVAKLIDGKYPDFRRVIPQDNKQRTVIGRAAAMAALKRLEVMTDAGSTGVSIVACGGRMALAHISSGELATEFLASEGDDFTGGFNCSYLRQVLGALDGEDVELFHSADDGIGPVIARTDSGKRMVVLMPMRRMDAEINAAKRALGLPVGGKVAA